MIERTGQLYVIIQKRSAEEFDRRGYFIGGGFLMLKDEDDYRAVVNGLPDLVVNAKPFKALMS
ncbi:hypothetical protein C7I87_24285 [Mesorhizobium sp. SARCC-RB16n]|nr:hypothetical protein C7I87_24285 [Mesorhizobium sp. SARCC-RB16n]